MFQRFRCLQVLSEDKTGEDLTLFLLSEYCEQQLILTSSSFLGSDVSVHWNDFDNWTALEMAHLSVVLTTYLEMD